MNPRDQPHPTGAPRHELRRSPAAAETGRLAAASGLFLAHFERRAALEPPERWLPPNRPDLGALPDWRSGVLPEAKYLSFRNDLMIGGFHPGHRAKWTAHELCHGLVGFAWRPDAPPLFHALAARLSELLPVALFYFFDEAFLNRCPDHQDAGPLFETYCADCERAAANGPRTDDPRAAEHRRNGRAFVDRELAAVSRSIRAGRPIASPWGSLDLCSDGLAYAAAQQRRLTSPEFTRFMALFHRPGSGFPDCLEALTARVLELATALAGEGTATPWPATPPLWQSRDLGWRLFEIRAQAEGELTRELDRLIEGLAAGQDELAVKTAISGYESLHDEYEIPEPSEVFAVGYELPGGYGCSTRQIGRGLASACPLTWEKIGDEPARAQLAAAFSAADRFERRPLGERFAAWLRRRRHELADLAAFEAAVAHAPARDAAAETLGATDGLGDWRLHPGVRLLESAWPALDAVGVQAPPEERAAAPLLAIRRNPEGDAEIIHLEPPIAALLRPLLTARTVALPLADAAALSAQGLIAPNRWAV